MLVRIERDYSVSGDKYPQFPTDYPVPLRAYVNLEDWDVFIHTLNEKLREAFCPWSIGNLLDGILSVLTIYISEFVFGSIHRKRIGAIDLYILDFATQHNLYVASLRNMGFLSLVFHTKETNSKSSTLHSNPYCPEHHSIRTLPSAVTATTSNISTSSSHRSDLPNEWTNSTL
ncbi:palmitoyltransferase complex accessory subunit Erf4 [Schizosaccharomyces pombe]|uniref:Ras modification protein erf4 n=1 Tax=Schizosaccharomyces pombe (strain 972 / ATCC 24843) TaxID=284812 RepID=ERFD_SCHPO|nr:putative palmitoyltransferase complex subunit Erf4 [Schizosaccharomyces pombe]Q10182.1 RecName: Full=Ras modification protein erf4; AltName: Full=Meiotically up-regulated gene 91 protein [Schizosaccharomyces pombe 972h-]CAA93305.1 palmitoyltransferase complex subunit Erf4 (predicted) [Schizosaccharomyces pombe]|eukprot:NP_593939.1 putative palmitoyltransferase complex subunit Erf4 [Schizosaccharomyces pombe]